MRRQPGSSIKLYTENSDLFMHLIYQLALKVYSSQGQSHYEETVCFLPLSPQEVLVLIDQPWKDERLSQPWMDERLSQPWSYPVFKFSNTFLTLLTTNNKHCC